MALVKCPECGHNMSEFAYKCPKCKIENENRKEFIDIDIKNSAYEQENFSYALIEREEHEKQEVKNKRIFKFFLVLLVMLFICLIGASIGLDVRIEKAKQISIETIEFMCGLVGEDFDENGNVSLYEDDRKYMEHSKIFGVVGNVRIPRQERESSITTVIWESEEECSYEQWSGFTDSLDEQYDSAGYYDGHCYYEKDLIAITAYRDESDKMCLEITRAE